MKGRTGLARSEKEPVEAGVGQTEMVRLVPIPEKISK